jgi:hypothetical protein
MQKRIEFVVGVSGSRQALNEAYPAREGQGTALAGSGAKSFGALLTGADAAEVFVAVDAGGMAIGEGDLNGVIAHRGGLLGARLGFEHGQSGSGSEARGSKRALLFTLVVASRAGALLAEVGEVVVAGVAVGPGNVHAGAAGHVNLHVGRPCARVNGYGHAKSLQLTVYSRQFGKEKITGRRRERREVSQDWVLPSQQAPGGIGLPCGQVLG